VGFSLMLQLVCGFSRKVEKEHTMHDVAIVIYFALKWRTKKPKIHSA